MDRIKQKRLVKDYKLVKKNPIENIWIEWEGNGENLLKAYSVICGRENSPYQHGFYAFDFDFSGDYPFIQPSVSYNSIGTSIPQLINFKGSGNSKIPRIHPNLYKNGYVCLSILGTWRGEGWSQCFNIQSISLELQSLLDENPITNEPSFEHETGTLSKQYIIMVTHANIRASVIGMLRATPDKYTPVRHHMIQYFFKHFESYIETCDKYKDHQYNKTIQKFKLYNWTEYIDFDKLKKELIKLKKELEPEFKDIMRINTQENTQKNTQDNTK